MIQIQPKSADQLKPLPPASDLKFGMYFSDHWFYSKFSEGKGWYESKVEPYGNIPLNPAASVLHYGQALFEGMKAFRQPDGSISLFRPQFNYDRLCAGAERLCLTPPPKDLFFESLRKLIEVDQRWVPKEENCSLYIRPTLIGTEPFLGVRPSQDMLYFLILSPVGSYYSRGSAPVKIWVETQDLRAAPGGLGATKAGANYAASLKAALTAKKKGYDQVLWLDYLHQGIEEVGTMNVFFIFKNEVVTPALNGSILPGGVRDTAIDLIKKEGLKLSQRKITIQEVAEEHAKGNLLEVFGTGTAAVITAVGELAYNGKTLVIGNGQTGALSQKLFETISGVQRGLLKDEFGWMVPLSKC